MKSSMETLKETNNIQTVTNNSNDDFELGQACSVIDPDCEACQ